MTINDFPPNTTDNMSSTKEFHEHAYVILDELNASSSNKSSVFSLTYSDPVTVLVILALTIMSLINVCGNAMVGSVSQRRINQQCDRYY